LLSLLLLLLLLALSASTSNLLNQGSSLAQHSIQASSG
jgi:hypothetical protein